MFDKPHVFLKKRRNPSGKICYTVRWDAGGKCYSRACGPDRRRAEEFKRRRVDALQQGIDDEIRRVDWEAFQAEHLRLLSGTAKHHSNVRKALDEFNELCSPRGPQKVTFAMVEVYVKDLRDHDKSARTINTKVGHLNHAFSMAVKRRYCRQNPAAEITAETVEEPIPEVLTDEEKQALLDACPNLIWRVFLYVLMTTACRRGEVLGLTWDRINLTDGYIRLTKTKSKRERLQPLTGGAVTMLQDLRAGAPMMVADGRDIPENSTPFAALAWNTNRSFERIREAAKVPHATMKAMRSTAASDTANSGFDVSQAGDFLGHADYKVTRRHYVLRDLENKRRVAESLASRLKIA